jgi:hypothetical protein
VTAAPSGKSIQVGIHSHGANQPGEREQRILHALEILALKLKRGKHDVIPIFEHLERELIAERSRRDVLRRADEILNQRSPAGRI